MKAIGIVLIMLLALLAQACFYHPYYKDKDSEWWYLEDWDTNKDRSIDKNEFVSGFEEHDMFRKLTPRAKTISYSDFEVNVTRIEHNTGEHPEDKPSTSSFDLDGDQKLSEPEVASAMFTIADDNSDNLLSGLEFYEWEVYLEPRDTVTTVTVSKM